MANPIIGITAQQSLVKSPAGPLPAHVVNKVYTDAVIRTGGTPVLLIPPSHPTQATDILERIDGLVLSGGGDIDPRFYGGKTHDTNYSLDPDRDEFEIALARGAQQRRTPLLAICRGLQVLNVALGGTLIEDIPSEIGSTDHEVRGPSVVDCHQTVTIEPDSLVATAIDQFEACVNSIHHQAVRDVAPGLRAAGWTPDGVIEVLDPLDHGWPLLAIQWHPEYLSVNNDAAALALFSAHVGHARTASTAI
ncbi:MAG: gamma-glutamyl-gamma-aminobutyrate hydrolase family protein [bacterium]|nr:gamma-glutamyl-gamma-aminobutyrate hydrolase family protein [bacterium]